MNYEQCQISEVIIWTQWMDQKNVCKNENESLGSFEIRFMDESCPQLSSKLVIEVLCIMAPPLVR